MFARPKVLKRCPKGHVMDPTWTRCPRCTRSRVRKVKPRDSEDPTIFVDLPSPSTQETHFGGKGSAKHPALTMGPALIASAGPLAGQELPLQTGQTRIGKAPKPAQGVAVIAVPGDRYMSKEHATLTLGSAALVLNDPGSTNGTFVNGSRVGRAVLQDGDELRVGESVFRVHLPR